jgi:Mrp family chromosome partitioning ATPase
MGLATPYRHDEPAFDFWKTAHRALRGRYPLALALMAGFAVAGAWAGFGLGKRTYAATGLVRIAAAVPAVMRDTDQNRPIANFDGFIQAQRDVMMSRETIEAAMNAEPWLQITASGRVLTPSQFAQGLKVESRPRSDHLKVTFTGADPVMASAAVRSVIIAFEQSFTHKQGAFESERLEQLSQRQAGLEEELRAVETERDLVADGRDIAEIDLACIVAADRVKKLKSAMSDVQSALAGGPSMLSRQAAAQRTPEELVADELLRLATTEQSRAEAQLAQVRSQGFASEHRLVRRLELLAQERRARVAELEAAINRRPVAASAASPASGLEDRASNLTSLAELAESELKDATSRRSQLATLSDRAATLKRSLHETTERRDVLETEAALGNRLTIVNAGDIPLTAQVDNRIKAAALGAALGAVLPLGAFMLGGTMRRRVRYSSDVAEGLGDRVPFVVALPLLESARSLSADAVRRVHDLRLRLQPRTAVDRRTLVVSDAAQGGEASALSLSLAMSFVSAGFRTLLVDGSLSTRRLTDLLEAGSCPGLMDATGGSEPLLWRTGAGFAFLSAGTGRAQDACRLSPSQTSNLLQSLRDRFDVVIVDCDSMTDGLSAPLFAPLVDGVVLHVENGDEVAKVREATDRVEALGGVLACAAFHGAMPHEFRAVASGKAAGSSFQVKPSTLGSLVATVAVSLDLDVDTDFQLIASGLPMTQPIMPPIDVKKAA